jgi:peptide/nickel transport system permease protein
MRFSDILLAVPSVMILILVAAFFRPPPFRVGAAPGRHGLAHHGKSDSRPGPRDQAKPPRSGGASDGRLRLYIIGRHMMPELFPLYLIGFAAKARMAMFMEASLSFLGLFDPSRKSLGMMINYALKYYYLDIWWNWIIPPYCVPDPVDYDGHVPGREPGKGV